MFHFSFHSKLGMQKVVRQVAGIDVAQKELVVCLGRMHENLHTELYASSVFANTQKGFLALYQWVSKQSQGEAAVRYVMEATGVYHEAFAYFLADQQALVSIVLPNKISNYARSLTIKTVTDKTASQAITQFGLERTLDNWQPPLAIYRKLKQLTREREQIVEERTVVKNQLHAEQVEALPGQTSISRMQKRIKLLDQQDKEIIAELKTLIKAEPQICELVVLLCSLPGVGLLTAAIVLGETKGFDLIKNRRQLVSFAGLDVIEKQSGTSIKGKPRISKKGNRYLRKAMHLPALTAIRHDERFKAIYARLIGKHGIKMKAAVAIQRKLLELMFTVYKTNKKYDKAYFTNQIQVAEEQKLLQKSEAVINETAS